MLASRAFFRFFQNLFFTFVLLGSFAVGLQAQEALRFSPTLSSAFSKIIPSPERDKSLLRLQESYEAESAGRTDLEQVLKVYRAGSLKAFLQELDGQLNQHRQAITQAERAFQESRVSLSEVESKYEDYRRDRLNVEELVSLILFYQSLGKEKAQLINHSDFRRIHAETARLALQVTKFPFIKIREHGKNRPKEAYSAHLRAQWREVFVLFREAGLYVEFLELWSQMVNASSGHLRFRHIEGFEDRFVLEVRSLAIHQHDPFLAQDLILSYLSSHPANRLLDQVGRDPELWNESQRQKLEGSAAQFLSLFARIKSREELIRFFRSGILPIRFASEFRSLQVSRLLKVLSTASQTPNRDECIAQLSRL